MRVVLVLVATSQTARTVYRYLRYLFQNDGPRDWQDGYFVLGMSGVATAKAELEAEGFTFNNDTAHTIKTAVYNSFMQMKWCSIFSCIWYMKYMRKKNLYNGVHGDACCTETIPQDNGCATRWNEWAQGCGVLLCFYPGSTKC